ncbi:MAG: hypothetical protein SVZ03_07475 [Spirochaetota bacterium]|nr:hypothetical protein [Spirochaetota bacterium]
MREAKAIIAVFFMITLILFPLYKIGHSSTVIDVDVLDSIPSLNTIDVVDISTQAQEAIDLNGPIIADAFTFANILGYPIGKAYIGGIPHFEFGASVGAGCVNMKYFDDDDPASDNGSLPGIAPNLSVHGGIGIASGIDVLGKAFYMSKSLWSPPGVEHDIGTLTDYMIYSFGGKIRFNIIKKKAILPFMFSFGGITVSLGGDFIYGDIKGGGEYEYEISNVDVEFSIPPFGTQSTSINMQFDGNYTAAINWSIFSITAQAISYIDLLYIFSLYSGFGISGNIGSISVGFDGDGALLTDNSLFHSITGGLEVGNLTFQSDNKYNPTAIIPAYIIGLEINILIVKLNIESMVNMRNRSDINVQAGVRFQI